MKRPKALVVAVLLLAAGHAYGIWHIVLAVSSGLLDMAPALPSAVSMIVYLILLGLLARVWRGRDWARVVCAIAGIVALLMSAWHLSSADPFGRGRFIAKALGVALLYVPSSNRWFRRSGPGNWSELAPLRGTA